MNLTHLVDEAQDEVDEGVQVVVEERHERLPSWLVHKQGQLQCQFVAAFSTVKSWRLSVRAILLVSSGINGTYCTRYSAIIDVA